MIRSTLIGFVLLAASAPVAAEPLPVPASDARLVSRLYDAGDVVRLEGRAGVQATIAFADDEHIENIAIGDSTSWQVTPNKRANLLFVKPLEPRARTNLTVVTDKHSYFFDLVASPSARPLYVLRFTYPEEPKPAPAQAATPGLNPAEMQLAAGERPVDPASLNFAWRSRGKSRLLPARIYDDGTATYVSWAAGAPIPAILVKNDRGEEGPVNFAVRGDVIVIDGVPDAIVLRAGRESATLENHGAPRPVAPAEPSPAALAAALPTQPQAQ